MIAIPITRIHQRRQVTIPRPGSDVPAGKVDIFPHGAAYIELNSCDGKRRMLATTTAAGSPSRMLAAFRGTFLSRKTFLSPFGDGKNSIPIPCCRFCSIKGASRVSKPSLSDGPFYIDQNPHASRSNSSLRCMLLISSGPKSSR